MGARKIVKLSLFLIILSLYTAINFAQTEKTSFELLSPDEGISQSIISRLIQDNKGFIWISTYGGLNKFDGYSYTIYDQINGDKNLIDNYLLCMIKDSEGYLWIGTNRGLDRFDPRTDEFMHFTLDTVEIGNNVVNSIYESGSGLLWIGTNTTLYKYDPASKNCTDYFSKSSLAESFIGNPVTAINEDSRGNIWVGTANRGLLKINVTADIIEQVKTFDNSIQALHYSPAHPAALYVGTEKGLEFLDLNKNKTSKIDLNLENLSVTCITIDNEKNIWIGTRENGLFRYNLESKNVKNFVNKPDDPNSISDNFIRSLLVDNTGLLWIGTNTGINRLIAYKNLFSIYGSNELQPRLFSNNYIYPIIETSDKKLWLGTNKGINIFNRQSGQVRVLTHDPKNKNSLSNNFVRTMLEDNDGNIWIGTYEGIDKYSPSTNIFEHFLEAHKYGKIKIDYLMQDSRGKIWASSEGHGLIKINPETGKEKFFQHSAENLHSIPSNNVFPLLELEENKIIVGTYHNGIVFFDPLNETFNNITIDSKQLESFNTCSVYSLHLSQADLLWIGTYGSGLYCYNLKTSKIDHYTTRHGLANNVVYGIIENGEGNLWLSTNNGLSKFNPKTKIFRNYKTEDGLPSNEFNGNSYYESSSGEYLFGTINGLVSFSPEKIKFNPTPPEVVITDFQIFNNSVPVGPMEDGRVLLNKTIEYTDEIYLSYLDNYFSIEYSALNFLSANQNQFAYKLENIDQDWNYVRHKRSLNFNLTPGEYTFRVKAANSDGIWNETGASLKIIISPPFWETNIFKFFVAATILLAVFIIYKLRTKAIQKRNKWLEENNIRLNEEITKRVKSEAERKKLNKILSEKNKELEEIIYISSHDLRAPLVNIEGFNTELDNYLTELISSLAAEPHSGPEKRWSIGEIKEAIGVIKTNTRKMEQLIAGLLKYSRYCRKELKGETINMYDMINRIAKTAVNSNPDLDIQFHIGNLPVCWGDPSQIESVFLLLIENAIQYKAKLRDCVITVSGKKLWNNSTYFVKDNGIGIMESHQKKIFDIFHRLDPEKSIGDGLGLALVRKIIFNHNGGIKVSSEYGKGTEFIIHLPNQSQI